MEIVTSLSLLILKSLSTNVFHTNDTFYCTLKTAEVWALALFVGGSHQSQPLGRLLLSAHGGTVESRQFCLFFFLYIFSAVTPASHLYVVVLTVCWRRWYPVSSISDACSAPVIHVKLYFSEWDNCWLKAGGSWNDSSIMGENDNTCSVKICLTYEYSSCPYTT